MQNTEGLLELPELSVAITAGKCEEVRELLRRRGIQIHKKSSLNLLLEDVEQYPGNWFRKTVTLQQTLNVVHAERIIYAILEVGEDPNTIECLRRIAAGDMFLARKSLSAGKDALWELVLLSTLRRKKIKAHLIDPPDIVCDFGFGDYAIACKNVHSEKSVGSQMKKGVAQLSQYGAPGIVAFNIDELIPQNVYPHFKNEMEARKFLTDAIDSFFERHFDVMGKYVRDGRCDGVLVSVFSALRVGKDASALGRLTELQLSLAMNSSELVKERADKLVTLFN